MSKYIDFTGRRFGKLVATEKLRRKTTGRLEIYMICDCGNSLWVSKDNLYGSHGTRSCGCLVKENSGLPTRIKPGQMTTHGMSHSPTWTSWTKAKSRCNNPNDDNYHNYGERGIIMSKEWSESFECFLKDMGERPKGTSLGRIDPNGNYCKENCRWESPMEQGLSRRDNVLVEYEGKKYVLVDLCRTINLPYRLCAERILAGKSIYDCINESKTPFAILKIKEAAELKKYRSLYWVGERVREYRKAP